MVGATFSAFGKMARSMTPQELFVGGTPTGHGLYFRLTIMPFGSLLALTTLKEIGKGSHKASFMAHFYRSVQMETTKFIAE